MSEVRLSGLWAMDRRRLIFIVIGGLIYGLLWALSHLVTLPNLLFISIRPAVAIPIFCGLMGGPVVGFGVGALGLFLGDFIVPGPAFAAYWDVSAGLLGLIAGLAGLTIKAYRSWWSYLAAELWALAAIYVSLDYITTRQVTYEALSQDPWASIFIPAFWSNSVNALILVPILIWGYHRFAK